MLHRILSGGQTGVDRAALDVALELGIACGGWCPLGRRAEDGPLSSRYPLRETDTARYSQRTRWNVRDSDGTLILTTGALTGGTALTERAARSSGKPVCVIDLDDSGPDNLAAVRAWLDEAGVTVLNVAGPRSSQQPGIYDRAAEFLRELLCPP